MRYFDHDTTASGDDLILALRLAHGGAAVDCYWAILEQIYREERPTAIVRNRPETQSLCVRLATAFDSVSEWVSTMVSYGLLEGDEIGDGEWENLLSVRAMENIESYQKMCEKNRLNGAKGGRKPRRKASGNRSANPVETQSVSERKAKKRKEKKGIGFDKQNQYQYADGVAAVAEATPPSCEKCGADMVTICTLDGGEYRKVRRCPSCGIEEAC